jgi:hypothetical protein
MEVSQPELAGYHSETRVWAFFRVKYEVCIVGKPIEYFINRAREPQCK